MKKRLFSLVLALCLLCCCGMLSGCTEKSAAEVINTAVKNSEALDAIAAEMKLDMHMAMEGITMDIPMTMDIKATDLKKEKPTMYTKMTTSLVGQAVEMEMYQEGDWMYIATDGMNYKMNAAEAAEEYDFSDDMDAMVQELPEELLKDVKLTKNEDGSQSVTVSIDGKKFSELYDDYIEDVNASADIEVGTPTIDNAVVTITVKDGYVTVYAMDFDMTVTVEEISSTVKVKATITYKEPGKAVTVTPMEGYQDFEEMTVPDMDFSDEDLDMDFSDEDLDMDFSDEDLDFDFSDEDLDFDFSDEL